VRRDELTEGGAVKNEKNFTKNRGSGDAVGRRNVGGEGVVAVNRERGS
jgi:hypothetical protein